MFRKHKSYFANSIGQAKMTTIHPTNLTKTENRQLAITWSDGVEQAVSFRTLRDACQCATCMEKQTGKQEKAEQPGMLKILTPAETRPLDIQSMRPVGNYAYNIEFSDGHSTGIFTFDLLRSLS